MRTALLLPLLLTAACAPADAPFGSPTPTPTPEAPRFAPDAGIDALLTARAAEQQLVGLAVGIVIDGELAYLGGYGDADRESGVPVDPSRTRFRWASISKSLTGVLAVRLAHREGFDLDAPIDPEWTDGYRLPSSMYDGDSVVPARPLSTRQLLSHTGGVQHYSNGDASPVPDASTTADPAHNTGFVWALDRWTGAPLIAPPGQRYSYSTFGPNLAGAVIGQAAAERRGDLSPDEGFLALLEEALGDTPAAGIQPDVQHRAIADRAVGYLILGEDLTGPGTDTDVSWKLPGGGFLSTAEELAQYCALLAGDDWLSEAEKDDLWTPVVPEEGDSSYGLGFGTGSRNGRPRVSHNGLQEKANTRLVLYPEEGFCLTLMTNTTSVSDDHPVRLTSIANELEDLLRERGDL